MRLLGFFLFPRGDKTGIEIKSGSFKLPDFCCLKIAVTDDFTLTA